MNPHSNPSNPAGKKIFFCPKDQTIAADRNAAIAETFVEFDGASPGGSGSAIGNTCNYFPIRHLTVRPFSKPVPSTAPFHTTFDSDFTV